MWRDYVFFFGECVYFLCLWFPRRKTHQQWRIWKRNTKINIWTEREKEWNGKNRLSFEKELRFLYESQIVADDRHCSAQSDLHAITPICKVCFSFSSSFSFIFLSVSCSFFLCYFFWLQVWGLLIRSNFHMELHWVS